MAVALSLAYDWNNKPQDCLAILAAATQSIAETDDFKEGEKEKCELVLESLMKYLTRFGNITNHALLKNKKFYLYADNLRKVDVTINDLWKNTCFLACFLASADIETPESEQDNSLPPADVNQWLEAENAETVMNYLNKAALHYQIDQKNLDQSTKDNIKLFFNTVKDYTAPLNYVLKNPVIIKNTPLDNSPNKDPSQSFNLFFTSATSVLSKIPKEGLMERLELLFAATNQTQDAISSHSSKGSSAAASPVKGGGLQSPAASPASGRGSSTPLERRALQQRLFVMGAASPQTAASPAQTPAAPSTPQPAGTPTPPAPTSLAPAIPTNIPTSTPDAQTGIANPMTIGLAVLGAAAVIATIILVARRRHHAE